MEPSQRPGPSTCTNYISTNDGSTNDGSTNYLAGVNHPEHRQTDEQVQHGQINGQLDNEQHNVRQHNVRQHNVRQHNVRFEVRTVSPRRSVAQWGLAALSMIPPLATVFWLAAATLYFTDLPHLPQPAIALLVSTVLALGGAAALALLHPARPDLVAGAPMAAPKAAARPSPTSPPRTSAPTPEPRPASLELAGYGVAHPDERQCHHCGGFDLTVGPETTVSRQWRCVVCGATGPCADPIPLPDVVVRSWLHQ